MGNLSKLISEMLAKGEKIIHLPKGEFIEKLHVEADELNLFGNETVISWDDYARKPYNQDELYGTFRSYTAYFGAKFLRMDSVTIKNTAGKGEDVGQALAAYFDCRTAYISNCVFVGYQDTIFTSPLPEKPVIPNSFIGPNYGKPRESSLLFFENCRIEGDVDFIFGGACAIFETCEIVARRRGYIAAPSTPKDQKYGFIFKNCKIIAEEESFLARPWRKDGFCAIIGCNLNEKISPKLWNDWDSKEKRENCRFFADIPSQSEFGRTLTKREIREIEDFIEESKKRIKNYF